jgi:hypothetical protein
MSLRRELFFAIGVLVVINLMLSFGAIGLFVRMGPAIEGILQENVYSIVAAEKILGELARSDHVGPLGDSQKLAIGRALDDAERNITEAEERPVLLALRGRWPEVAVGTPGARATFVADVERLVLINRNAMVAVDEKAKRLGNAGAWSAVLVGFLNFLVSLIVLARLERRFVGPLLELHDVLMAAQEGQHLRRCRSVVDAPREVLHLTQSVNQVLDERLRAGQTSGGAA